MEVWHKVVEQDYYAKRVNCLLAERGRLKGNGTGLVLLMQRSFRDLGGRVT